MAWTNPIKWPCRASGAVVGAVVQVLIAPQATPSGIAFALPRFGAGSVLASWIAFTFVTFISGPSRATSSRGNKKEIHIEDFLVFVIGLSLKKTELFKLLQQLVRIDPGAKFKFL